MQYLYSNYNLDLIIDNIQLFRAMDPSSSQRVETSFYDEDCIEFIDDFMSVYEEKMGRPLPQGRKLRECFGDLMTKMKEEAVLKYDQWSEKIETAEKKCEDYKIMSNEYKDMVKKGNELIEITKQIYGRDYRERIDQDCDVSIIFSKILKVEERKEALQKKWEKFEQERDKFNQQRNEYLEIKKNDESYIEKRVLRKVIDERNEANQRLTNLQNKYKELLSQFKDLQEGNKRLSQSIEKNEKVIEELKEKIQELEKSLGEKEKYQQVIGKLKQDYRRQRIEILKTFEEFQSRMMKNFNEDAEKISKQCFESIESLKKEKMVQISNLTRKLEQSMKKGLKFHGYFKSACEYLSQIENNEITDDEKHEEWFDQYKKSKEYKNKLKKNRETSNFDPLQHNNDQIDDFIQKYRQKVQEHKQYLSSK